MVETLFSDAVPMGFGAFLWRFMPIIALTASCVWLARIFSAKRIVTRRSPRQQVDAVHKVEFSANDIDDEEVRALSMLETILAELAPDHRVMVRVSLGELLRPSTGTAEERRRAEASIHSKRLDFAILDPLGRLVLALGWIGRARRLGTVRDSVRRAAVERAGLPYLDIGPDTDVELLCRHIYNAIHVRTDPV